jgi:putative SOS response-associated peptidase YedK
MLNMKEVHSRDMMLANIVDKYSEWLEMSEHPEHLLIEILSNMLFKAEEYNKYLNKVAFSRSNTYQGLNN